VPAHVIRLLVKWRRTERALWCKWDRIPSFDEVASELGLSRHQRDLVAKAHLASQLKLESSLAGESAYRATDAATGRDQAPDTWLEAYEERCGLLRRLERLTSCERTVVTLRYGLGAEEPLTFKEIGYQMGLAPLWVRKVAIQAVKRLVHPPTNPDRGARDPDRPRRGRHAGQPIAALAVESTSASDFGNRDQASVALKRRIRRRSRRGSPAQGSGCLACCG
jgi:DNA-directed RNA polymerase sigma subunit (sigma70/sigma32)